MAPTLVVELFTEELPRKALKRLGEAFAEGITAGLRERGFFGASSAATPYATPRRLAVAITQGLSVAPDAEVVAKLMPETDAWDAASLRSQAYKRRLASLGRQHM